MSALLAILGAMAGGAAGALWRAGRDRSKALEDELVAVRASSASERAALAAELEATRARASLSATLAEELRLPLRGTLGVADSLASGDADLPPRVLTGLGAIVATGKRLDRMISDLIECRSHDDLTLELAPIDLHAMVSEVMVILAPLAGEKRLELVNDVSMNFPIARGDETRVGQVLAHFIGSALKATDAGEVRIGGERVGGMLRVSVTDSGPALAPNALAALFDDAKGDRGLAFAKKLVMLQRGEVAAVSAVGQGTTLSFTLPEAGPGAQRRATINVRTLSSRTFRSSIPVVNKALSRAVKFAPSAAVRVQDRLAAVEASPGSFDSSRFSLRQMVPTMLLAELDGGSPSSHAEAPPPSSTILGAQPSLRPAAARPSVLHLAESELASATFASDGAHLGCRFVPATTEADALGLLATNGPFAAVVVTAPLAGTELLAFARAIRKRESSCVLPLVLVVDGHSVEQPSALFEAGASDVVLRSASPAELLERLRSQLAIANFARAAQRVVPREFVALLGCSTFDELTLGLGAERALSVLFADLQGFTKASERMTSRQVFAWLNGRFGAVVPAIREHGGFVDKFIGDAVMALFAGGPAGALRAAVGASHAMRTVDPVNRLGIGVHHGPTMIGTLGEKERFAPTVVSDTVNVAARLEALTRRFGSSALVSEETLDELGDEWRPATRYLGAFRVKGREKALRIHELLDAEEAEAAAAKRAAAPILQKILEFVDRSDLANASRAAAIGAAEFPNDHAFVFYIVELERVARHEVPFDGVIALQEK